MYSLSGWAMLKAVGILLCFAFLKVSICALLQYVRRSQTEDLGTFCSFFPIEDVPAKEASHNPYTGNLGI